MKKSLLFLLLFSGSVYCFYSKKVCLIAPKTVQGASTPCLPCVPSFEPEAQKIAVEAVDRDVDPRYYWTPLLWAIALNDTKELARILDQIENDYKQAAERLAQLIWQDWAGRTSLYLAVEWIERDALKMLLERASRWFANDPKLFFEYLAKQESLLAWSPLHGAAYGSFSEGIALLITAAKKMFDSRSEEFKAFINLKDNFGRTPLNLCFEIWDRLYIAKHGGIASFVPELEDSYHAILKKDLLKYAAYSGFNKELNEVLRHGIQLYSQPSYKRNTRRLQGVLQEAGLAYDFSRKEFLDFITARDEAGWSPLMNAAADGNAEYVELILRAANAFYKDDKVWVAFIMNNNDTHGRTVWHIAISRRHLDVVKALIRVQKEIAGNRKKPFLRLATHRTELNGFTPLIAAVYESADDNVTFAIIKLLVERAAEVLGKGSREFLSFINRKDYNGYTALSYAVTPRIQKFLKEYGAE